LIGWSGGFGFGIGGAGKDRRKAQAAGKQDGKDGQFEKLHRG
jgi:hypothetical protein